MSIPATPQPLAVVCEHFQPHQGGNTPGGREFLGFARFRLELAGVRIAFPDCRVYQEIRRGETKRVVQFAGRTYETRGQKLFSAYVQFPAAADWRAFQAAAVAALAQYQSQHTATT